MESLWVWGLKYVKICNKLLVAIGYSIALLDKNNIKLYSYSACFKFVPLLGPVSDGWLYNKLA